MRLNVIKKVLVFVFLSLLAGHVSANLRCGNYLVQLGDDFTRVQDICGQPYASYPLGTKYLSANRQIHDLNKVANLEHVQTVITDMWVYKPGQGKLSRLLYFENGILVRIKNGKRN